MMKLAEILSGPETWCQRALETRSGRHCLMGAVHELIAWSEPDAHVIAHREWARMDRVVRDYDPSAPAITVWNDDNARVWEDIAAIVEAFDRDRLLRP